MGTSPVYGIEPNSNLKRSLAQVKTYHSLTAIIKILTLIGHFSGLVTNLPRLEFFFQQEKAIGGSVDIIKR